VKRSHKAGLGFGVTSGIITPLGLIVGLYSGTNSNMIIIGGLLTIAVADSFSDAVGIHVSKETDVRHSMREVWEATIATFFSKLFFALMFVIPFLLFSVRCAVVISIGWGTFLLALFSYFIAKGRGVSPWWPIGEHLSISCLVIVVTYYVPILLRNYLY